MLRTTIFACAAAAACCFAASAVSNGAAADPANGAAKTHPATSGNGALAAGANGGRTQCFEAECGGDTVPIDDNYVVRGCGMTPAGQELPPWCESSAGATQATKAVLGK